MEAPAGALLEVAVLHARDVPGAIAGGADRLALAVDERSPDLSVASAVLHAARDAAPRAVVVRVLLRLDDTLTTSGGGLMRLIGLAEEYLALGAEGLVFGFLDGDLEIDVATTEALARALPGVPWTFHRGVDATLDAARSWGRLLVLPGLTAVATAGSLQGVDQGIDDLVRLASSSPDVARLLMPAGELRPEHVPWLVRAGVRQVHLDDQVRPGGSPRAYVDAEHVRSWRLLVDDAVARETRRARHVS